MSTDEEDDDTDDTAIETSDGPMSIEEALADPDRFVLGMTVAQTYCVFVAGRKIESVTPGTGCEVRCEPYTHLGQSGTLLTTRDKPTFLELQKPFPA